MTEAGWIPYIEEESSSGFGAQSASALHSAPSDMHRSGQGGQARYAEQPGRAAQPARKRPKKKRKRASVGTIIWRILLVILALLVGTAVGSYVMAQVPDPEKMPLPKAGTAYFSDGKTPIGTFTNPKRSVVPAEKIAPVVRAALIASQDPYFEQRPAAGFADLATHWWESLWGGGGANEESLTDKFVQAVAGDADRPLLADMRDAFLPVKIDHALSKDEIVTAYLNTAYFGRDAYGIEAAAQAYFGVSAQKLSTAQAAMLVAVMPAPAAWDPAVNKDEAHQQFAKVLQAMVSNGTITKEEADGTAFPAVKPRVYPEFSGPNGYLLAMVRAELTDVARIAPATVERAGLSVTTSIDQAQQQAAVKAVQSSASERPKSVQVGLFSLDPRNGEVVAVYGGADYSKNSTNAASQARVPAGMPFGAFAMAEAMEQGVAMNEQFYGWNGVRTNEGGAYSFFNVNGKSYGLVNIQQITKFAVNSASVHLNGMVNPENTRKRAVTMGISAQAPGINSDPGNVLGDTQVTAKEMARAYAAFAADGILPVVHAVREVKNASGATIYTGDLKGKQVLKPESAQLATYALHSTFTGPEEAPLDLPGMAYTNGAAFDAKYPAAGQASSATDRSGAWFVGYTKHVVTAVNMFERGDDGAVRELEAFGGEDPVTGSGAPLKLWSEFMTAASSGQKAEPFADVTAVLKAQKPHGNNAD